MITWALKRKADSTLDLFVTAENKTHKINNQGIPADVVCFDYILTYAKPFDRIVDGNSIFYVNHTVKGKN